MLRRYTPLATTEFEFRIHQGDYCGVVGYVHGLLFLHRRKSGLEDLILCNPSMRKGLIVPPSPSSHLGPSRLGFGYDPISNDYKVVSIVYIDYEYEASFRNVFEVYSLRTESWRSIGFDLILMCNGCFLHNYVYANGALHWIVCLDEDFRGPENYFVSHLISFDLGTELFSYKKLPEFDICDGAINVVKLLVVFHGSVAVFFITACHISVWVMREGNWINEWTIGSGPILYNYLSNEMDSISSAIFSDERSELLVAGSNGMVSYDIETRQFKFRDPSVIHVDMYMDSLLWRESLPHWKPLMRAKN